MSSTPCTDKKSKECKHWDSDFLVRFALTVMHIVSMLDKDLQKGHVNHDLIIRSIIADPNCLYSMGGLNPFICNKLTFDEDQRKAICDALNLCGQKIDGCCDMGLPMFIPPFNPVQQVSGVFDGFANLYGRPTPAVVPQASYASFPTQPLPSSNESYASHKKRSKKSR